MSTAPSAFANYLVLKDEVPFLVVNATLANVERLVSGFGRDPDHRYSFRPCS